MLSAGLTLTLKQLAVRGDELIGAGICPDETAKTLDFLLCECVTGNVPNEKERLIKHANVCFFALEYSILYFAAVRAAGGVSRFGGELWQRAVLSF